MNADLHIHTCLSPCGDLEMAPRNIIRVAKERGLGMIAITDHNTTRNVQVCMKLGEREGIHVIPGCEVNTREEVHTLCYFPHLSAAETFQSYLDRRMTGVKNDPLRFGYQVAVDENDRIVYEEERSLFMSIRDGIEDVADCVHRLGGLFVPAHVDRPKNSLFSQLGFIPPDLEYDALEISKATTPEEFLRQHPGLKERRLLQSSDAHYPEDIARACTRFEMEEPDWEHFTKALLHARFETFRCGGRASRTGKAGNR
ncbi:MAG: PHP domain-containing protein [Proteiniphilum sp.]|jgi:PHP family Zn ribbon phosphoesterase|nr:PHP domain-containing protein [Proteiniphilum sp.]